MAPVIALFVIALVSLLAVRVGSTALMMTGLSWDAASFQAYSAFFGVGFTTREAELVMNHPLRRRIIRDLIFAGNVGLTSALATLVVTLLQSGTGGHAVVIVGTLLAGLILLCWLFRVSWFQRLLDHIIQRTLESAGMVKVLDYELLLRIRAGYVVSEIEVLPGTLLDGRTLRDTRPRDVGVMILAIKRSGQDLPGLPGPAHLIQAGDVLTVYGKEDGLEKLIEQNKAAPTPLESKT
ncbi:MAG: TrkA C-terminal domain-containing protein [Verrucomicrobiales bacterium]|nr:TrkA C-terminal domain-containing protein [Verrucomicrobiales bacterium]MCP5560298.1 TrkA C-terminal domain-containing protein [Verrucomicrobiaceae bacterium]